MLIVALIIALLFTGLFAGIEIAFISANKLSIELRKKQGRSSGIVLNKFAEHFPKFIGTCLVLITIFTVAFSLLLGHFINYVWAKANLEHLGNASILKSIVWLLMGSVLLVWVRSIFKAYFKAKADFLTTRLFRFTNVFYIIFGNISQGFISFSVWLLKYIFNVPIGDSTRYFNRYDLEHFFQQTHENEQEANELNEELLENALNLPSIKVRNCLVPRREIVGVNINEPIEKVYDILQQSRLSRIVVYNENIDDILGYIHQLDMYKNPQTIQEILLPIPAVPETMGVTELINRFSKERKSIAWVVDEFGGTAGIVTMEDLLEEIFGEIQDEYDTEDLIEKQTGEKEYLFSGRLKLDYLTDKYRLEWENNDSETLSGYIVSMHNAFPKQAERVIIGDYRFEIITLSNAKIDLIKMQILG